jgi:hypothetical protein
VAASVLQSCYLQFRVTKLKFSIHYLRAQVTAPRFIRQYFSCDFFVDTLHQRKRSCKFFSNSILPFHEMVNSFMSHLKQYNNILHANPWLWDQQHFLFYRSGQGTSTCFQTPRGLSYLRVHSPSRQYFAMWYNHVENKLVKSLVKVTSVEWYILQVHTTYRDCRRPCS